MIQADFGEDGRSPSGEISLPELQQRLDQLVDRATKHLGSWSMGKEFRAAAEPALVGLLLVPLLLLVIQVFEVFTSYRLWSPTFLECVILSVLPPVLYVVAKMVVSYLSGSVDRPTALALYDRQLVLKDRLVTADQFLHVDDRDCFTAAAIEDAAPYVDKAMAIDLDTVALSFERIRQSYWLYVPAALAILLLTVWIGSLPSLFEENDGQLALLDAGGVPLGTTTAAADVTPRVVDRPDSSPRQTEIEQKSSDLPPAGSDTAADAGDSDTRAGEGPRSESDAVGKSGNSGGHSAKQASSNDEQRESQSSEKKNAVAKTKPQNRSAPKQEEGLAATAGEISGEPAADDSAIPAAHSDSDADEGGPSDDPRRGSPNDSNERSDDQDGEGDPTTGGGDNSSDRSVRDSNNSELTEQPGPESTGGRPSAPGGSKAHKKSRGVMSMILGVPLPDKIAGSPGAGQVKTIQEKTEPKEENAVAVDAQYRTERATAVGYLEHPDFSLSMQALIQNYFLHIRNESIETEEDKL